MCRGDPCGRPMLVAKKYHLLQRLGRPQGAPLRQISIQNILNLMTLGSRLYFSTDIFYQFLKVVQSASFNPLATRFFNRLSQGLGNIRLLIRR